MTIRFLSTEEVLQIHQHQLDVYGGSEGIRDLGALDSALAMPAAGMDGEYFHKDLIEMAAAYLFHIAKNHPLVDGNKRVALGAALYFLHVNGQVVNATQDSLLEVTLSCAAGKIGKSELNNFFRAHSKPRK